MEIADDISAGYSCDDGLAYEFQYFGYTQVGFDEYKWHAELYITYERQLAPDYACYFVNVRNGPPDYTRAVVTMTYVAGSESLRASEPVAADEGAKKRTRRAP